jgi:hypothetical protein
MGSVEQIDELMVDRVAKIVAQEREWLKNYCRWRLSVVAYAIEVDCSVQPITITCSRFHGRNSEKRWRELECRHSSVTT